MAHELEKFSSVYQHDVVWGDMDALGHVNNVVYYRYIENARINYFKTLNLFSYDVSMVISHSQCRYLSPVTYPDTLYIATRVEELRNSAIRMSYQLFSQQQSKLVAQGESVLVCLDPTTQAKINIPAQLKQGILDLEQKTQHIPIMPHG